VEMGGDGAEMGWRWVDMGRRWGGDGAVLSLFEPFKMIDFEMRWIFIGGSCKTFSTFVT